MRLKTGDLLFVARDDHKPQPGRPNWNHGNLQDIHAWLSTGKGIAEPSVDAGLYIEEIKGKRESLPVWEF